LLEKISKTHAVRSKHL